MVCVAGRAQSQLEAALAPFLEGGQGAIKDIRTKHGPKEAADVQLALAYTVNALFFVYLKTQGVDPQTHPVMEELGRVREYMRKLKTAVADRSKKDGAMRLNKEAASRFISAALGGGGGGGEVADAANDGGPAKVPADTAPSAGSSSSSSGSGGGGGGGSAASAGKKKQKNKKKKRPSEGSGSNTPKAKKPKRPK
eukprot:COSAG01_NODE_2841_length_6991_cov_4.702554_8_plen_195_part_00